jgi:hypothetical protein
VRVWGLLMEIECFWAKLCHKLEGTLEVNIRVVNYLFFSLLTFRKGKEETYENSVLLTGGAVLRSLMGP